MPKPQTDQVPRDVLIGVAIVTALFLFSVRVPIFGFLATVLIPLPVLFYRSKLGRRAGAVVPVLAVVLMFTLLDQRSLDSLFFLELLGLGFVIGELYEKNLSVERTVLLAGSAVVGSTAAVVLLHAGTQSQGVSTLVSEYVSSNLELTLALYEKMGVPEENMQILASALPRLQYWLVKMLPALVVAGTLLVTLTNVLLSRPVLLRCGLDCPAFGPLNRWKAPEPLIWALIGSGILLLIPADKAFKIVGLNGLLVLLVVYFFQGMAIVSFYFQRKQVPMPIRVFVYAMIVLQQFFRVMVIGLGLFDMWLDFRKLDNNADSEAPGGDSPPDGP